MENGPLQQAIRARLFQQKRQAPSVEQPAAAAGGQTPFFFAPVFNSLAEQLAGAVAFHPLAMPDGEFEDSARAFTDLAARQLRDIRRLVPDGPFLIGGFCVGAVLAFEVARQLEAAGQTASLVAMIDPPFPGPGFARRYWLSRPVGYWNTARRLPPGEVLPYVLQRLRRAVEAIRRRTGDQQRAQLSPRQPAHHFLEGSFQALCEYHPAPVRARLSLFFSDTASRRHIKNWRELALGGLAVERLPGSHEDIFFHPHVSTLARSLQAAAERSTLEADILKDRG